MDPFPESSPPDPAIERDPTFARVVFLSSFIPGWPWFWPVQRDCGSPSATTPSQWWYLQPIPAADIWRPYPIRNLFGESYGDTKADITR